jgi:tetratricopeptide (TPR) repeat protein
MACERYRQSIHELIDGTLGPIRKAELELHLDQCDDCRGFADDLRRIRETAASLDELEPPDRVWLQIAGRLRQEGRVAVAPAVAPRARRSAAMLALAAALVLAVAGSIVVLMRVNDTSPQAPATAAAPAAPGGNAVAPDAVESVEAEFRLAEQHYQNAIAKLEEAAKSDDDTIDAQTAAALQKNLQVIDQAIAESRAALRQEPQSTPARDSLFEALRRKVLLLQDTIALMNEMRKGDSAGAAQILNSPNKS